MRVRNDPSPVTVSYTHLDVYKRQLQDLVVKQLAQAGRMQARAEVKTVLDETTHTAGLHVNILSEGPPAVLAGIECRGLKRDSEAALLKYLELEKGRPFLSGQVPEIEDRLLRSARYTSYKAVSYTHLDVYKRQAVGTVLVRRQNPPQADEAHDGAGRRGCDGAGVLDRAGGACHADAALSSLTAHVGVELSLIHILSPAKTCLPAHRLRQGAALHDQGQPRAL